MEKIIINKMDANQRIDKYVRKLLNNAPLDYIYKLFRKKDVKVNGKRVKQNYVLQENDEIIIYLKKNKQKPLKKRFYVPKVSLTPEIVYEDANIIVVNKEYNVLIHSYGKKDEYNLNDIVLRYLYDKKQYTENSNFTPSPVHRLDRNTSGLVIYAKNFLTSKILNDYFKNNLIERTYLALVVGEVKEEKTTIQSNLKKDTETNYVKVVPNGKKSLTKFSIISQNENYSLLKVNLISGRPHQIRVHFKSLKHPILNDHKYGIDEMNNYIKNKYNFHFPFLHAYFLKFPSLEGHLNYLANKEFKKLPIKQFQDIVEKELGFKLSNL